MPQALGGKQTTLLNFQMRAFGPGTFTFNQGDQMQVSLSAKNNSSKNIPGKVGCILRDPKSFQVYASVDDWTSEIDGPGIKSNAFEINTLYFNNFGVGINRSITLKPNDVLELEMLCDTSNFAQSSNPSTLSANILNPGSIIYSLTDVIITKNRYHAVGTPDVILGLPIKQQELSTGV